MARVQIFLSAVSAEFRSYRDKLREKLTRPNVSVAVQEDFIATGTETLDKLDEYIRECDAVIHLIGDMTGAMAKAPSVAVIRQRYPDFPERLPPIAPFLGPGAPALSYTQWEAWLALYHRKQLFIAVPDGNVPRDVRFESIPAQRAVQQEHLQRLDEVERYPEITFANPDSLAASFLGSALFEVLKRAGPLVRPTNLPFRSLGALFKGRETELDDLARSLGPVPASNTTPVVARVLNGLGGVGKTRLAIEYAWRRAEDYNARLFVVADSAEALQRNLAALCAPAMLDLPEQRETEEGRQYEAVLRWLRQSAGWLLILDNIDSKQAAEAVEALLPQFTGGHLLLTSRLTDWSPGLSPVALDVLTPEAATDFLLVRTDAKRRKQANDTAIARSLGEEFGGLALALEQAGAYIEQRRLSLDRYLADWQTQRDKMLVWLDTRLMQYHSSVAITWQTSFEHLTPPAQQLLQRLAWLAPDPIPESLLDIPVPEDKTKADAFEALAELESYSLVTRANDSPSFTVHRLVQEVARRSQHEDSKHAVLLDSLRWIAAAFTGDPTKPKDWPMLEPLLPHARAISTYGDAVGVTIPSLMNQVGLLLYEKALYHEAEPLYQMALEIREQVDGPDHLTVAESLDNLATLYSAQGAYAKAEPLQQRALTIKEQALGPNHADVALSLHNLAALYSDQGGYAKAEPLYKRALTIKEQTLDPDHADVALSLNGLAALYHNQGIYAKAEPLYQRALKILEQAWGPKHPTVTRCYYNLGALYLIQKKDCAKAEFFLTKALKIREQVLGTDHPDVGESLNGLAMLYSSPKDYAKAEPLLVRTLAIQEQVLGSEHPAVAKSLNNLASLYHAQSAYTKAEPLYLRTLEHFLLSHT